MKFHFLFILCCIGFGLCIWESAHSILGGLYVVGKLAGAVFLAVCGSSFLVRAFQ